MVAMRSLLLLASTASPSVALFDKFWRQEQQEQLYSLNGAAIPDYGGDPSWLEWEDAPVRRPPLAILLGSRLHNHLNTHLHLSH